MVDAVVSNQVVVIRYHASMHAFCSVRASVTAYAAPVTLMHTPLEECHYHEIDYQWI